MSATPTSLSRIAFLTLLLIAVMMGANHVSARFAFNDGVSVTTAVIFRSGVTALIILLLLLSQRVSLRIQGRPLMVMPLIGALVAIQSYCLYSAVARLPVALALLAFNTYPLWAAFWARIIYRHRAEKFVLRAMPVILFGLALARMCLARHRVWVPLRTGNRLARASRLRLPRPPRSHWRWC